MSMSTRSSNSNQSSTGAVPIKLDIIVGNNGDAINNSNSNSHSRHEQRDDTRDPYHDSSIQSDNEREGSPSSPNRRSSPILRTSLDDDVATAAAAQSAARSNNAADDNGKKAKSAAAAHKAAQKKIKAATARAKKTKATKSKSTTTAKNKKATAAAFGTAPIPPPNGYPDVATMMASASSFDQVMATTVGPSPSFGELPVGNFLPSRGHPSHLRRPSGGEGISALNPSNFLNVSMNNNTSNNVNHMPMSELDNPSWDLLNQDSFGFNLLGSHGSLSFDTEGQAVDYHPHSSVKETIIGGGGSGGTIKSSGRERERSVDLTSAVTASLDDTPNPNKAHTIDWATAPVDMGDTTIVNSMNHSWIPPHSPPVHHAYSHHGHPSHYMGHPPPPHHPLQQESRSDIPHSYLYSPEMRDAAISGNYLEDPFKYAFGDPNAPDAESALMHPNGTINPRQPRGPKTTGRARSKSTSAGRNNATATSSSRRPKKRKPAQQEPLDGHHSPPPLKTIESAPTNTLEMMNPPSTLDPSWSASPGASRRRHGSDGRSSGRIKSRGGRARSRTHDKQHPHYGHPDIGSSQRSSSWHRALGPPPGPPIMGGYHPHHPPHHSARGPPPFPSNGPGDPIHSAFLPPMPTQTGPPHPPPSSAYNHQQHPPSSHPQTSGNNPPREVYITTKPSGTGSNQPPQPAAPNGGYRIPPPQFVNMHSHPHGRHHPHHPPPYPYPPNMPSSAVPGVVRSSSNVSGHSKAPSSAPRSSHMQPLNATVGSTQQHQHQHIAQVISQHPPLQPHQQQPQLQQTGRALLTLPSGTTLTRLEAPGIGWPPEEDLRLTEVMSNHKSSQVNWDSLCMEHGMGRTARECHDRWTRYLKPGSRKGQWREEEDAIVLKVIFTSGTNMVKGGKDGIEPQPVNITSNGSMSSTTTFVQAPFTQWADLAPQLPGRTGKQIRDRWVNYLNPAINHLPFSRQDDLQLWAGHTELGKRWVEISAKIFHNTRSENHIKNRWYSAAFKKFIAKEFGMDAYVDAKQSQGGVGVAVVANAPSMNRGHQQQQQQGRSVVHPQFQQQQGMHHHKQVVHQVGGRMHRNGVLSLNSTNLQAM